MIGTVMNVIIVAITSKWIRNAQYTSKLSGVSCVNGECWILRVYIIFVYQIQLFHLVVSFASSLDGHSRSTCALQFAHFLFHCYRIWMAADTFPLFFGFLFLHFNTKIVILQFQKRRVSTISMRMTVENTKKTNHSETSEFPTYYYGHHLWRLREKAISKKNMKTQSFQSNIVRVWKYDSKMVWQESALHPQSAIPFAVCLCTRCADAVSP